MRLVVAAGGATLLLACTGNKLREPTSKASEPPVSPSAHVGRDAKPAPTRFVAVISARHIANVSAQVEGTLKSVDVRLGEAVQVGDVLATIDDRLLRQSAAAARAGT